MVKASQKILLQPLDPLRNPDLSSIQLTGIYFTHSFCYLANKIIIILVTYVFSAHIWFLFEPKFREVEILRQRTHILFLIHIAHCSLRTCINYKLHYRVGEPVSQAQTPLHMFPLFCIKWNWVLFPLCPTCF